MMTRKIIISLTLLSATSIMYGADHIRSMNAVDFAQVRIHDSFWSPRLDDLARNTIPHCIEQIEIKTPRMCNFINSAVGHGEHSGLCYDDSDVYKALEGIAYSLINTPDSLLEKKADEWIDNIAAAQWDDGYLNTYYTLVAPTPRWTDMIQHEMYCAGHLFEAAVAYYTATGKRKLLDVACRMADHMMDNFGPGKRHWVTGHEEVELALVRLADVTGKSEYTDFALWLLEERGHGYGSHGNDTPWGTSYCQDEVPVERLTDVSGHAVRAMYLYCGMADVAAKKGNHEYLKALERLWVDVTDRNMYLTGGIGSSKNNEGFTKDYDLPNKEAYCETCASVGLMLWAARMNRLTCNAKYVDVLERTMYNAALAGVQLGGQRFFYVNPLESDGTHHRQEWYGTACCPSNISRFLPSMGNYIYGTDEENIYVNLFIGNETSVIIDGIPVRISVSGNYPFEGVIDIIVESGKSINKDLKIRIPKWCKNYAISLNGSRVESELCEGYVSIPLEGNKTCIRLDMAMTAVVVAADPRVKEDFGKRAVMRGPLVYCMEECDNPTFDKAAISSNTVFSESNGEGILKGFKVLHTDSDGNACSFIPYFAWDNRKSGKMKVWIDLVESERKQSQHSNR